MKIVDNLFVKVRKLWNAMFGRNGDGSEIKLVGANPTVTEESPKLYSITINGVTYSIDVSDEEVQAAVNQYIEDNPDAFDEALQPILDGTTMVGLAKEALNLKTSVGVTDTTPFLFRTTAGALECGSVSRVKKIVGGSLPIIQLIGIQPTSQSKTESGVTITDNRDGTYTVYTDENGATANVYLALSQFTCKEGHIYYWRSTPIGGSFSTYYSYISGLDGNDYGNGKVYIANETKQVFPVPVYIKNGTVITTPVTFKPLCFELTQTFGTTVANRLYALEQAQAGTGIAKAKEILTQDYYPYNVTDFTHVKTSGKVNTGFNQFNIATKTNNGAFAWANGQLVTENKSVGSDYIEVVEGNSYYCNYRTQWMFYDSNKNYIGAYKTDSPLVTTTGTETQLVVIPTGYSIAYVRLGIRTAQNGNQDITQKTDINLNLHWDGERDGEFEPYVEYPYTCSNTELKGIVLLDASDNWVYDGDEYLPDGTIVENVVLDKVSDHAISKNSAGIFYYPLSAVGATNTQIYVPANSTFTFAGNGASSITEDNQFYLGSNNIGFRCDSAEGDVDAFKTIAANVYIILKLATPTESSADPYTELQDISNWGTEKWLTSGDVVIPVGNEIFYPIDIKAKGEVAPNSPTNDGTYVMIRDNGQNSYGLLSTWLGDNGYVKPTAITGYDNTKTQTLKNVEGTLTWVDDQ